MIFMTHLDVGYTASTVREVLEFYVTDHFPAAFNTSRWLRERRRRGEGEEQFVYTTHAWLLDALLRNQSGVVKSRDFYRQLKGAIDRGDVTWHASPFNLQYEASNRNHMDFAYGFAHTTLDIPFRKTRKLAASQKDTPGFTTGMVSLLQKHGIRMIHIGVNDFSTPPAFPHSSAPYHGPCHVGLLQGQGQNFHQRNYSPSPLLVIYCSGYSASYQAGKEIPVMITTIPGFSEALVFLMHVDNLGPQTAEQVMQGWRETQSIFPNASLMASSLDSWTESFFREATNHKSDTNNYFGLPLIDSNVEFGDTWIYGISSDPTKVRWYRAVLREVTKWIEETSASTNINNNQGLPYNNASTDLYLFYTLLLKVPEHTWGSNGIDCSFYLSNVQWHDPSFPCVYGGLIYERTRNSWLDQRHYITQAIDSLMDNTLKLRLRNAITDREPLSNQFYFNKYGNEPLFDPKTQYFQYVSRDNKTLASLHFNESGTIIQLSIGNTTFCSPSSNRFLGALTYRTHSEEELNEFGDQYCLSTCSDSCGRCSFSKCDMGGFSSYNTAVLVGDILSARARRRTVNSTYDEFLFNTTYLDHDVSATYGAPAYNIILIGVDTQSLHEGILKIHFDVTWYQKPPTRMAESIWFSFSPQVLTTPRSTWRMNKMGKWVDPLRVVTNGSKSVHAIWDGIRYYYDSVDNESNVVLEIYSPDAPVVSPNLDLFPPGRLNAPARPEQGWAFDLFNNAWNTNYPLWSLQESERFQFTITLKAH
jgi:hypothetical protein